MHVLTCRVLLKLSTSTFAGFAIMDEIVGSSIVYVDTNIFVYFIESSPTFFQLAKRLFEHIDNVGARILTSEITLAECIYKPSKDNDLELVGIYESVFERSGEVELLPLDGAVAKRSAIVAGNLGLKLIDAIHYLSALESGCDYFVTSDASFKSGPTMAVIQIGQ